MYVIGSLKCFLYSVSILGISISSLFDVYITEVLCLFTIQCIGIHTLELVFHHYLMST